MIELEEMKALLEYVHGQARGDLLWSGIEDDEMLAVYLPAGKMREIAQLVGNHMEEHQEENDE